jgi:hypothetical protein
MLRISLFLGSFVLFASSSLVLMAEKSTFSETEKALGKIKSEKRAPKKDIKVEVIGSPFKPKSEELLPEKEDAAKIDPVNSRVIPAKKDQKVPITYGTLPSYGLSVLFYKPTMRSAYILNPKQWNASFGFAYSAMDMSDSNAVYREAKVDAELYQAPFSFSYGLEWSELQISGAFSKLSGEIDLIETLGPNAINPTAPEYRLDDIQIDWFIDLETFMWRKWEVKPDKKKQGKHLVSLGLKVPVGSTSRYLSSGAYDISIGSYNSYHVVIGDEKSIRWDASAQLIFTQPPRSEVFQDKMDSKSFVALQSLWATEILPQTEGYVGLGYRTASLKSDFEAFETEGAEYFIGIVQRVERDGFEFQPKLQISGLGSDRFGLQAHLSISY